MGLSIKDIKMRLQEQWVDEQAEWFLNLQSDERKGVQQLIKQYHKGKEQEGSLRRLYDVMSVYEKDLWSKGYKYICGTDGVGLGCLAGATVAASVILPEDCYIPRLNDSKKLSERVREELYVEIARKAIAIGIGGVSAKEIDEIHIYEASKKSMIKATQQLPLAPDYLLIDALTLDIPIPQKGIGLIDGSTPLQRISLYKETPTIITTINIPVPFQPIPPVKSVKYPLLPLFHESFKDPVGLFYFTLP